MSSTEDILERIRRNIEAKTKNPNVEAEKEGNRDLADNSVTKSRALCRAYYRFGLVEKRVMEALISKVHPQRLDNPQYIELSAMEYSKAFPDSATHAYEHLSSAVDAMVNRVITIIEGDKITKTPLAYQAIYEPKKGYISFAFHPLMLPHLVGLNGKVFGKYPLKHAVDFSSSYTWRFFEILVSWAQPKKDTGGLFAGWISKQSVDELRKMLGVPESYQWVHIDRTLNIIQSELKDKAGIALFIERVKTSRKITHLNIKFIEEPQKEFTEEVQTEKPKRMRKKAA